MENSGREYHNRLSHILVSCGSISYKRRHFNPDWVSEYYLTFLLSAAHGTASVRHLKYNALGTTGTTCVTRCRPTPYDAGVTEMVVQMQHKRFLGLLDTDINSRINNPEHVNGLQILQSSRKPPTMSINRLLCKTCVALSTACSNTVNFDPRSPPREPHDGCISTIELGMHEFAAFNRRFQSYAKSIDMGTSIRHIFGSHIPVILCIQNLSPESGKKKTPLHSSLCIRAWRTMTVRGHHSCF